MSPGKICESESPSRVTAFITVQPGNAQLITAIKGRFCPTQSTYVYSDIGGYLGSQSVVIGCETWSCDNDNQCGLNDTPRART